jgi:hypothetical protein
MSRGFVVNEGKGGEEGRERKGKGKGEPEKPSLERAVTVRRTCSMQGE